MRRDGAAGHRGEMVGRALRRMVPPETKRCLTSGSDYSLGQQIAALFKAQRASDLPPSTILSQLQDLLGSDTALLGPLRDLLLRPAYRQLQDQGAAESPHSPLLAGRDALLQDLALTYHPAVVARLAAVIDGSLALPPAPPPLPTIASPPTPPPIPGAAAAWSVAAPGVSQVPPSVSPSVASAPWSAPSAPVMPPPAPTQPPAPSGPSAVTALLIALVSMLTGAVLLGLGWMLFSSRPQPNSAVAPASAPSGQAPAPAARAPLPPPPPTPKQPTTITPAAASSAWGDASEYKFGQLPGGDYPNSCAFSVTDANGRTTTDKSQVEYWACRDVGGDPETGYRVVWADGKETNYTFQSGGDGQVVGTNGSTYPMRWRNDTHQGEPIVVINHQDGAITWIPGQIN